MKTDLNTSVDSKSTVVVFSCDQKYFPGFLPALRSLKRFHPQVHVVLIDIGLNQNTRSYISQFVEVVQFNNQMEHNPAWGRFALSLLNYRRVVYLDCDIIVLKPLDDLFNSNAEFVAVKNLDWRVSDNFTTPKVLEKYNISPNLPAFNAGVFSIDNRKWGEGKLLDEAWKVYKDIGESFTYGDQSALQILMNRYESQIAFIGEEYNAFAEHWNWEVLQSSARLIHYTGEIKPWHQGCSSPKKEFFFYYSKSSIA